ncbi:MAG: phage holin family protein [Gemmatimonadota bacterium]
MRLILRILINAAALWAAVHFVSGIHFTGSLASLLMVALIFGVLNAIVRPILMLLSLPLLVLTLGLFTLVLNAIVLLLTSAVSRSVGLGLRVSGFSAAFWGAIVISIVSIVLSIFIRDTDDDKHR